MMIKLNDFESPAGSLVIIHDKLVAKTTAPPLGKFPLKLTWI